MTKQEHHLNRSVGCLLGGAVGDALGAPVEFIDRHEIFQRFGAKGIRDYVMAYGRIGAITDDTQMTLFTAEGCLLAFALGRSEVADDCIDVIRQSYLRWLKTQGISSDMPAEYNGWLMEQDALFSRRAPGNTCLSALRHRGAEQNQSKGCGGIMRVAPCGILYAGNPDKAFMLGLEAAKLTHGHPTGYLSAAVFAAIIAELMVGKPLPVAIQSSRAILVNSDDYTETLMALDGAIQMATVNKEPAIAIPVLGEGWVAEEALAISIYCALTAKNLEEGIVTAVNITGDSDSTGAITGNILGAMAGVEAIPSRWLEQLELRDVIETVAQDLVLLPLAKSLDVGDECLRRYIRREVIA